MAFRTSPMPSILAVIVALLLGHSLYAASAASGGRMGGSSFSSESSQSSSRHDDDRHPHHHHYYNSFRDYGYNSRPSFTRNSNQENGSMSAGASVVVVTIFIGAALYIVYLNTVEGRTTVLQVQVGLSAKARSLQKDLTEIALMIDGSTANGRNFILEETISALLHLPDCYLYGYSSVTPHWTIGGAEQHFKRLSNEERQKFDVESLVNINNIRRRRTVAPKADKANKDCIVVTVLVAAQGAHNLPAIWTNDNAREALQSLAEICTSKLKAVEVLWSPQEETDSLSVEELLENYPQLRRI